MKLLSAILILLFSITIGITWGVIAFFIFFFFPVFIFGSTDVLLLWGWIATPVGAFLGVIAATLTSRKINQLLRNRIHDRTKLGSAGFIILVCTISISYLILTFGDTSEQWSIDVVLSDRSTVKIKQKAKTNTFGVYRPHRDSLATKEYFFEIQDLPATAHWQSKSIRPILIDKDPTTGTWFFVAPITDCTKYYAKEKPHPSYIQYIFNGSEWNETTLNPNLIGRSANLLISPRFGTGEAPHLTAEEVSNRNREDSRNRWEFDFAILEKTNC